MLKWWLCHPLIYRGGASLIAFPGWSLGTRKTILPFIEDFLTIKL
jgi:hypothetical protein